jgi:4-hydroxythreonine-4-phosphate dehydrogenase
MTLAISMGEPAGVGPDCVLLAHAALAKAGNGIPAVVFGDPDMLAKRAKRLGLDTSIETVAEAGEVHNALNGTLCVVKVASFDDRPGELDPSTADGTVRAIYAALDEVRLGTCSGIVTAPIHKANLYANDFAFPGHTELLEAYAREHYRGDHTAVMMLAGPQLRTVPVTVHIPLHDVAASLTARRIVEAGKRTAQDLAMRFGIKAPRLAVAGLNPHAGENGALGHEDDAIISPAVKDLQSAGINAWGPLPADTMFHDEARRTYDAALCMYHDQALIPVKALDFHNTVNVTLGLPFVRTSPDHGTALSLAGKGNANPASTLAAMRMAARMSQHERAAA